MNKLWGALRFMLANTDKVHIICFGAILLMMLVLAVLHHRWQHYEREMKLWKKLCLIPLGITTVHYFIFVSGFDGFLMRYSPMYLTAIIALLPVLCAVHKKGYRVTASAVGVLSVVFCVSFFISPTKAHNYTRKSYTKSFRALVKEMDRSYVIKEWKEIDFSALEEKYMPQVREAEQESDPAKFADAVIMFCNELHDGHVAVHTNYDREKYASVSELKDYGLSMTELDSGEVIAVCTNEKVHSLGIKDGTVITKWNGMPVLQAAEEKIPGCGQPVRSNAERLALFELAGSGGESVEVSFIDDADTEQTTTLSALDNEHTYDDAYDRFAHLPENYSDLITSNYHTEMLDDKCGYLILSAETIENVVSDNICFYAGKSRSKGRMFRSKLRKLREQGMEYLIIDMRNNMGGNSAVGVELCSLFTNEDRYSMGLGVRRGGENIRLTENMICADGEFADLSVVVLTNFESISAGDVTARDLAKLPNVTLAGITDPNGSGQITGGCCILSDSIVSVNYPIGLTLDENGEPDIDTRADQVSRDPVEVRIPFDYDAAMKIFRDKEDYELEWAVNYLENNAE
ncbi:S41 family peptidase [Ruminococcus sp.]|uniref:S41 family peptidase n=1 Tax=Ruminococcus sp. TaxID=41978 RepID=UPI0025F9876E|nr:S41 family peptidase [Ruminococcus sp.]MCR4639527.1 hypothetical protein [Ruminococcus sp.]